MDTAHAMAGHTEPSAQAQGREGDRTASSARAQETEAPVASPLFYEQLAAVFLRYSDVQQSLSQDQLDSAKKGAEGVLSALQKVDMQQIRGEAHSEWMRAAKQIDGGASQLRAAADIAAARRAFETLSIALVSVAKNVGTGMAEPLYLYHCPMAFGNSGAEWLQRADQTENPYMGSAMFRCGSQRQHFVPSGHSVPAGQ